MRALTKPGGMVTWSSNRGIKRKHKLTLPAAFLLLSDHIHLTQISTRWPVPSGLGLDQLIAGDETAGLSVTSTLGGRASP